MLDCFQAVAMEMEAYEDRNPEIGCILVVVVVLLDREG